MMSFKTDVILRCSTQEALTEMLLDPLHVLNGYSTTENIILLLFFLCYGPVLLKILEPNQSMTIRRIILVDIIAFMYTVFALNISDLQQKDVISKDTSTYILTFLMHAPALIYGVCQSEIMGYVYLWTDFIFYEYLYPIINGPVPPNVYQLNFQYNNIYECHICLDPFCKLSYGDECVLKCGHRFHSGCLREWELNQLYTNHHESYKCAICQTSYNWHDKWEYKYTIALW